VEHTPAIGPVLSDGLDRDPPELASQALLTCRVGVDAELVRRVQIAFLEALGEELEQAGTRYLRVRRRDCERDAA
jgi:hypothetical protein